MPIQKPFTKHCLHRKARNARLWVSKARAYLSSSWPESCQLLLLLQVLIGRNNVQNDELSHQVASDGDLWFHAKGLPGSHTILRIPSGQ